MTGYLVDTNVFSETRRRHVDVGVREWFDAMPKKELWMSVITDLELERGVLLPRGSDPVLSQRLRRWLVSVRAGLMHPPLVVTDDIARVCAGIQVPDRRPLADALIAAAALHHGLTVVTRNVRDFDVPGLGVLNPFAE